MVAPGRCDPPSAQKVPAPFLDHAHFSIRMPTLPQGRDIVRAIARSKTSVTCLVVFGLAVFAWRGALGESPDAASARASRLLGQSGFRGGLVVHLGCGDGRLTAALHAEECYLVHGLDADEAKISAAREHINSQGLYGKVCVEQWESDLLPYVDNVVRLLVA